MTLRVKLITGVIFICLFITDINCQTQFDAHLISNNAMGAWSVFAIDIDGDIDMDVLSASMGDNKIAWYENDGNQNFTPHTISTDAYGANFVRALDMDGDTDVDVISTSNGNNVGKIVWYENDGNQNFTPHIIIEDAEWPQSGYPVDLDLDYDIDVIFCELLGKKIRWCESDGNQNFTSNVIATSVLMYTHVYPVDLDEDNDIDILSTSVDDDINEFKIEWYENDGQLDFTSHIITENALGAAWAYPIDIDGDTDYDIISASYFDNKIAWYENDGNENFSEHIISVNAEAAWSVFAVDLDNDDDIDVLSASAGDNKVTWYENDGNQNFTPHTIADYMLHTTQVYAEDIDGDSDYDVLAPSRYSNEVFWFENKLITGINFDQSSDFGPNQFSVLQNYPNPFNPSTVIKYQIPELSFVTIKVYDVLGNEITTLVNEEKPVGEYELKFEVKNLPSGIYFYTYQAGNFTNTKKMILLK